MKLRIDKLILPIVILFLIIIILFVDIKFIIGKNMQINKFAKQLEEISELNKDSIFKISKIIKYSSAEAVDNTAEQTLQDVSIHQYSDIAIYIDKEGSELTEKNTVKELYLDDFNVDVEYKYGTRQLYYKNPLEISKFRMIDKNKIGDKLSFEIVNTNKENEESDYEKPVFFADCSNPITIGFINKDIINNYQVTKENGLVSFDGRIFNNLDFDLKKLSPKISFLIHIKNNLDEEYICKASVKLNLETKDGTIKSGYIIQIKDNIDYYRFFRKV